MCKKMMIVMMMVMVVVVSGCQLDIQGPNLTAKALYKGENGDKEFLSRGSGMSGGNGYHAGGGNFLSWGNNEKK